MKASFRNCRAFSICREQDKTANRMDGQEDDMPMNGFLWGFNSFSKERNYSVTHDEVEPFLFLKECFYALAFSQDMYQLLHHQDSAKTFYI